MGSRSDWDTMQHAVKHLEAFGIAHDVQVVSAHRTPDLLFSYAERAQSRGLRAIIAGATWRSAQNFSLPVGLMRVFIGLFTTSTIFSRRSSVAPSTCGGWR